VPPVVSARASWLKQALMFWYEEGPNIPKEKGPAPGQERKMLNERDADVYGAVVNCCYAARGIRASSTGAYLSTQRAIIE
jgi:hypothetical protein